MSALIECLRSASRPVGLGVLLANMLAALLAARRAAALDPIAALRSE